LKLNLQMLQEEADAKKQIGAKGYWLWQQQMY
jgi:hypothetical protein